jgi:methionine-rich copper-binding protein CopC
VTLVLAVTTAGTASAHAALRHAHPSAGEELAVAPAEISIAYSTGVDLTQAEIHLTDAAGAEIALAKPEGEAATGETLVRRISGTLSPGNYKVRWRVLSIDGHWTRGDYTFVVSAGDK